MGVSGRRRNSEARHAAVLIQKSWRGHVQRTRFWSGEDALGAVMCSTRIQRVARGFLGRRRAARSLLARRNWAAARIQALYWGKKGRTVARQRRESRRWQAAIVIQGLYRHRRARYYFYRLLRLREERCTLLLQRHVRGMLGRRYFAAERRRQHKESLDAALWWQLYVSNGEACAKDSLASVSMAWSVLCGAGTCNPLVTWRLFHNLSQKYHEESALHYGSWIAAFEVFIYDSSASRYGLDVNYILEQGVKSLYCAWLVDPDRKRVDKILRFCALCRRVNEGPKAHILFALAHSCFGNMDGDFRLERTRTAYQKTNWHFQQGLALSNSGFERDKIVRGHSLVDALFCSRSTIVKTQRRTFWLDPAVVFHGENIADADENDEKFPLPAQLVVEKKSDILIFRAQGSEHGELKPRTESSKVPQSASEPCVDLSCKIILHAHEIAAVATVLIRQLKRDGRFVRDKCNPDLLVAEHLLLSASMVRSSSLPLEKKYSLSLKLLQTPRDEEANRLQREWAARKLQQSLRGYEGRVRWQFIKRQLMERRERELEEERRLLEMQRLEACKYSAAQRIQALVRGFMLRKELHDLRVAAKCLQTVFRRFRAKNLAREAEKFKVEGARVETVFQRGFTIGGVTTLLSVLRSGLSFKFVAVDPLACQTHVGYCYETEVVSAVRGYNKNRRWVKDRIKLHQYEDIANLLVSRLKIVKSMLPCPTHELRLMRGSGTCLVVADSPCHDRNTVAHLKLPDILAPRCLSRPLADMHGSLSAYSGFLLREERAARDWERIRLRQLRR